MSVGPSWLLLILLPLLSSLLMALAQPAGLWDDAAQEAEDCHLQAVLLAATQAEEKQKKKGFKGIWMESSLPSGSPPGGWWLKPSHGHPSCRSPGRLEMPAGAQGSPMLVAVDGATLAGASIEGSPLPPGTPSAIVTILFAMSWPR